MTTDPKKTILLVIKAGVTVAIFVWLFRQLDANALLQTILATRPGWLALAIVAAVAQIALIAIRWRVLLQQVVEDDASVVPRHTSFVSATFAGQAVNQMLPTVAGDATRALLLGRLGVKAKTAIKSVVLDRGLGGLALLALAPTALLLSPTAAQQFARVDTWLIVCFSGIIGSVVMVGIAPRLERVTRRLSGVVAKGLNSAFRLLAQIGTMAKTFPRNLQVTALTFAVHLVAVVGFVLAARALSVGELLNVASVAPLILLASIMPFAFGGWGVREGAAAMALGVFGIPPEQAVAVSVLFGASLLAASLPGVFVLVSLNRRPHVHG